MKINLRKTEPIQLKDMVSVEPKRIVVDFTSISPKCPKLYGYLIGTYNKPETKLEKSYKPLREMAKSLCVVVIDSVLSLGYYGTDLGIGMSIVMVAKKFVKDTDES